MLDPTAEHATMASASDCSDKHASATVLFKFVTGVLNGAYQVTELAERVPAFHIRRFDGRNATSHPSFESVCDGLAAAISDGFVPQRGLTVLSSLMSTPASVQASVRLRDTLMASLGGDGLQNETLSEVQIRSAVKVKRQQIEAPNERCQFLTFVSPKQCPTLARGEITKFVSAERYGQRLCGYRSSKSGIFDRVAAIARTRMKDTEVISKLWHLRSDPLDAWLDMPINLWPRMERLGLLCIPDVYRYTHVEPGTLVVDFANKHVGGGCFSSGFVQEEQMVAQSVDFAVRLHMHRQHLTETQAMSYEGIHIDAWWPRDDAAKKDRLNVDAIQPCVSNPLTILAVDAPVVGRGGADHTYTRLELEWLTRKILLVFSVADLLQSPRILSGLLGGGAFRNNRPLILLLHLLLQPLDDRRPLVFHHPIFASFGRDSTEIMEQRILHYADAMLDSLRSSGVSTLREALAYILDQQLPYSNYDADLAHPQNATRADRQRQRKPSAKSVAEPSAKSARWKPKSVSQHEQGAL